MRSRVREDLVGALERGGGGGGGGGGGICEAEGVDKEVELPPKVFGLRSCNDWAVLDFFFFLDFFFGASVSGIEL